MKCKACGVALSVDQTARDRCGLCAAAAFLMASADDIGAQWRQLGRAYADQLMAAYRGDEVRPMAQHLGLDPGYYDRGCWLYAEKELRGVRWGADYIQPGTGEIAQTQAHAHVAEGFRRRMREIAEGAER